MVFHKNRLLADESHKMPCVFCYFEKSSQIRNCRLLQIRGGPKFMVLELKILVPITLVRSGSVE